MQNLNPRFVPCSNGQIYGGDFAKFCGLLRIYELLKAHIHLYVQGGYVWAYATVLIGLVLGSIYVTIIMRLHTWKSTKDQVMWMI